MKVIFETNRAKIRNTKILDEALHIIEHESMQGFFRSKGESEFKKFGQTSIVEDAKKIELHIVKVYGKGEFKFNGNLSYNQRTKEVKFYILSVIEFDNFNYDDVKMAEFTNKTNESAEQDIDELKKIIEKIKKTKPAYDYKPNNNRRGGSYKGGSSRGGSSRSGDNKYSKNSGSSRGGDNKYSKGSGSSSKSTPNPKRTPLTPAEKAKREKNQQKKNFRTDQRRNVSNNKK